nr:DUF3263 domain-containing protein [Saccharomonospora iraqiensis]
MDAAAESTAPDERPPPQMGPAQAGSGQAEPAQTEPPRAGSADGLSEREVDILAFEHQWWRYAGAKEQAIRDRFGVSPTRYYQILNKLIDKQEAMRADPMLVKRLRKVRASRQRTRAARRLGIELP